MGYGAAVIRAIAKLLLLTLLGCAYMTKPSHFPSRGAFVCVENRTPDALTLYARDGIGRTLKLAQMQPDGTYVGRWPFVHTNGMLLAGPHLVSFEPWSAEGWRWTLAARDSLQTDACP